MGCNIEVTLKEIGLKDADLFIPAKDRDKGQAVVKTVMNF